MTRIDKATLSSSDTTLQIDPDGVLVQQIEGSVFLTLDDLKEIEDLTHLIWGVRP